MKEFRYYRPEEGHGDLYELAAQQLKGGERVLDLCCGAGYGCEILLQKASYVIGVDYDPECIAWARKQHPKCPFEIVDLCKTQLPLRDRSVDVITWIEGIEHLETIDMVLKEIRRVAKPGARLFIATPSRDVHWKYHKHFYSLKELLTIFPGARPLGLQGRWKSIVILWTIQP